MTADSILKRYSLPVLKATLSYQALTTHAAQEVTMGNCMVGCGKPSRGGGVCYDCIKAEIEEREKK